MARVALFLCALLLLFAGISQASAGPGIGGSCATPGARLESLFTIWGESQHWALILDGIGTCRAERIETAKAESYLVWTGDEQIPKRIDVTFTVRDVRCIQGTIGVAPGKVTRVGYCKLVYPGQGLLTAQSPEELVKAITTDGRFVVEWDGRTEQITWRYGSPVASAMPSRGPSLQVDNDYRNALRAANNVLLAWYRRDWHNGPALLAPAVQEKYPPQQMKQCFLGLSSPQNWAFEVVGKERVSPDRFRFHVWTYQYVTADHSSVPHAPPLDLDVVRRGGDTWLVDTLPCTGPKPMGQ